ncbi:hypothetical protein [Stenotrophomonas maltophilia]|uniref:hypothetical protein n=1 Tax=Stenotrophomonas maltophilia TaxID=40324 RepID=UPI0015F1C454|nr:hypothetical protein [Stenotrophomonas maltophilia]QDY49803.1 hypothetical protein DUW70_15305 [Stenotrophomonas maltophilia]
MADLQQLAIDFDGFQHRVRGQFEAVAQDMHVLHGEKAAMDLWIHALIATHPNPAALKARVQDLVGQVEKAGTPDWAVQRRDSLTRMLQRYGAFFDQVHPGV